MPTRPNRTFPSSGLIPDGTAKPTPDPKMNPEQFDEFIRNNGLEFIHFRSMFCPNIIDLETHQHDPNCGKCDNGYQFYGGWRIFGTLSQNKLERMYEVQGLWELGEAVVTFQSYRDDEAGNPGKGEMNDFMIGDKLQCVDYTITWQELIESSPTGFDRLKYPAAGVEALRDMNRDYVKDIDFEITADGLIKWLPTGKRPPYNQIASKGGIYSIVYTAHPVFFVKQMIHELRATKGHDANGGVIAVRLPQQVLIQRDVLFKHPADNRGKADTDGARDGGLVTPG